MGIERRTRGRGALAAATFHGVVVLACLLAVGTTPAAPSSLEQGLQLMERGKLKEAEPRLLEAVREEPRNAEAHHALGALYLRLDRHDKVIECGRKAVEIDGSSARNHLLLARGYVRKAMRSNMLTALGPARSARREYEATIALDPRNVDARDELLQFYLGAPSVAGGDEALAVKQAEALETLHPLTAAYGWARIWQHRKNPEKTEASLRRAVALDTSTTFEATRLLGLALTADEKYAPAESVYQSILARRPDDMDALYQVGRCLLLAKKDLPRAEQCFKRYLHVPPGENSVSWAGAHWRLGMVYDLQGKRAEAIEEVRKAVAMDPKRKEFKATLKELEGKR
jgi:tetratricopeptide (TPR) repeat protein